MKVNTSSTTTKKHNVESRIETNCEAYFKFMDKINTFDCHWRKEDIGEKLCVSMSTKEYKIPSC